jgi:hypothetical protein
MKRPEIVKEWEEGMMALHREAAGVIRAEIYTFIDARALALSAASGSVKSRNTLRAMGDFLAEIGKAPRKKPMLCGTCNRALRRVAFDLAVIFPEIDNPTNCLVLGICSHCASKSGGTAARTMELAKRVWPELRTIEVHQQTGRA